MKPKLEVILTSLALVSSPAHADPVKSKTFVYYNSDSKKNIKHDIQDGDRFLVRVGKVHYCPQDSAKCFPIKSNNSYFLLISLREGEHRYDSEILSAYRRYLGLKD